MYCVSNCLSLKLSSTAVVCVLRMNIAANMHNESQLDVLFAM